MVREDHRKGKSAWKASDVDLVIPHQVSLCITQLIAEVFDVDNDRIMMTLGDYGNTAAASIPIALDRAVKEDRIGEGSKVLLVGGAAGFSAGAISMVW